MKVILAEKPSVARDIARVVGATGRREGWLEGNGYQVTWAFGHLIGIVEPELMQKKWGGKWNFDQLPMIPDEFKLTTYPNSEKQFHIVSKLFNECDEIINAADAGREGELIFRWIYDHSKCAKPFKRLWISDLTDESIQEGLRELHPGVEFDPLGQSAQCRAFADWMVGLNATRAYSVRNKQLYTVGRVQTPTLALIVNRDKLIKGFEKTYYHELYALTRDVLLRWENEDGYKIERKERAESLKAKLKDKVGLISQIKKTKRQTAPPPLYDLTLLQKECNEKFGYTAQDTLSYAQLLYERHKVISYPRTESRHLSEKMRKQLPNVLRNAPDNLQSFAKQALANIESGHKLSKSYIDDKKLTDHHAIIPTQKKLNERLDANLNNVYTLIQKRFIAIFLADFIEDVHEVVMMIESEKFKVKGSKFSSVGWRQLYQVNVNEPYPVRREVQQLIDAEFKKGEEVRVDALNIEDKESAPPKAYNDGTLLNAMKYIGKQVDDESLAAQLKDQGLGTQATRASIIERLIKSQYVNRKGKSLLPTDKGVLLIDTVVEDLKSPELTASWEQKLSAIQDRSLSHNDFMKEIEDFTRSIIPIIKNSTTSTYPKKDSIGVCPKCKEGQLYEGKKAYYCSRYRDGCEFVLWWTIASKKITPIEASKIIKDGSSDLIK
ncbi:MAG: DNA topoisomerase-3, partial [Lysobacterales bacterium]